MAPYSNIIGRRTIKPILWNLVIQSLFLSIFIFGTCANIFHPLKWLYDWYTNFFWDGSWLYLIPLTGMVICLASASTEDYLRIQPFYSSRISLLKQAITPHNLLIGCLHISMGFLIPWTYSSLLGGSYKRFWYYCDKNKEDFCFSEKRAFLIDGGMWVSLLHFFHGHFFGTRYLKFPVAQMPKFVLIKGQFLETFKKSIKWIILPIGSYVILYYLKIGSFTLFVAESLGCTIEDKRLDTISGLLDLPLMLYLIIFSTLITVTMRFMEMFSRVYLTARFYFPFHAVIENESPALTEGLKMSNYPIMQHLAFLDLMLLSNHSQSRREEIFKLSSFGGHPHLWNAVKQECFNIVTEFIEDLDQNMNKPPQLIPSQQKVETLMRRNVPDYFSGHEMKLIRPSAPNSAQIKPGVVDHVTKRIKMSLIYVFIFGERNDMKTRHTLRLSLPVSWACESLSFLACHSLKEDKYGILINDLPDIIKLLLQLKHALENLLKRTALGTTLSSQDLDNIAEATALKKSVKRSIYRIVNTFKNYINALQISKDIESQLIPYIMYRE